MKRKNKNTEVVPAMLSNERNLNFTERGRRYAEIQGRISESYPMVGGGGEDYLWRSLSSNSNRDISTLTQKRMQDVAFYLYDSNPMAKRIVEIIRDFVVGDGFTYTAEDPDVLEVIDEFWNDPDNKMDIEMDVNVLELSIFGENCFPVWVNPVNGAVKLGYIDPVNILKVVKDKSNPRINNKIIWKAPKMRDERELNVVNIDKKVRSETYGKLIGDCFFFTVNKVSSATRGRSDLLTLADWLDGHDQFLFARLERAFLLNAFIWDITCDGMNEKELQEFVKGLAIPRAGSIRAHNEKIHWKAESPKLDASDASEEARLFKNQILGGAGFPEHWFAEGSKTTRATALEMSLPTLKRLKTRQKAVKYQIKAILDFVIDQAIIHKRLEENVNRKFKVVPSPIVYKDSKGLADSISGLVDGLLKARDANWIKDKEAKNVFNTVVSQIGVDIESDNLDTEEEGVPAEKIIKKEEPKVKDVKRNFVKKDNKEEK